MIPARSESRISLVLEITVSDVRDYVIRRPLPLTLVPQTAPISRDPSYLRSPPHALATPRPTLLFAIASDDPQEVRRVLQNGEAGANDMTGPQSALAFTLNNDRLTRKLDIVKTLLAFGADPAALKDPALNPPHRTESSENLAQSSPPPSTSIEEMDPATRYYMTRAAASNTRRTSALIQRSFFRPLTRMRYELVWQDRALEQLFRVLSIHSQQLTADPIVVLLCGPSGHGKSLLASKFGALLDVPTHTVNMTTLRSAHDLWQSYSVSPYEEFSTFSLAEFLVRNEGKRCVVVLDEMEKTEEKALWSLLMPWELGRCSFEAGSRSIDVRNVIWLGTSNIGRDIVLDHHASLPSPDELMSREVYVDLMTRLRKPLSDHFGASILSRVTTVLPFVPFTIDEQKAICAEALYTLGGDVVSTLASTDIEGMITRIVSSYSPVEGARSLLRAVSNQLVDAI